MDIDNQFFLMSMLNVFDCDFFYMNSFCGSSNSYLECFDFLFQNYFLFYLDNIVE